VLFPGPSPRAGHCACAPGYRLPGS